MILGKSEKDAFYELSCYTTARADPQFIHQYVVDAFAAQYACETTKSITITFALVGLYLHIEKDFTGKEVQRAHIQLAKHKRSWPKFKLPEYRGNITIYDVIAAPEGSKRDEVINKWCASVWDAYKENHYRVVSLVKRELWPRKG